MLGEKKNGSKPKCELCDLEHYLNSSSSLLFVSIFLKLLFLVAKKKNNMLLTWEQMFQLYYSNKTVRAGGCGIMLLFSCSFNVYWGFWHFLLLLWDHIHTCTFFPFNVCVVFCGS